MEHDLLSHFFPEGLLNWFEVTGFEHGQDGSIKGFYKIHLTEKNRLPEGYSASDYESKGFFAPKSIMDFPIRGRTVFLVIKRRRWRSKTDPSMSLSSDLSFLAEGTKMTAELADFLKAAH
jgi:hypothetical protein